MQFVQQPQAEVFAGFVGQFLDQSQPPADPTLVPAQELGDLELGHAVLTHQGVDDPGFFPLLWATAGLVEPVDSRLGHALIGLQETGTEGLQADGPRGGETLETVENLVHLFAKANDHGSELSIALERSGHGGIGIGQSTASIALAQLGQDQEANIAGMPISHEGPRQHAPNSEQENGGPENAARPLPPRFWGQWKK